MKIYLTSASPNKIEQCKKLEKLWHLSSKRHSLCHQVEEADLIIVTDISGHHWFQDLRENKNIKNPSKCFVLADGDIPMPLLHGIYTSNHRGLKFKSRFRTGAYNLFSEQVHNPFILQSSGNAYLYSKKFLYSFVGQDSSFIRKKLFQMKPNREDVLISNSTSYFNAYNHQESHLKHQERYSDIIMHSKFALCPKGTSGASIRLFEVMKMGVAPVIISDDWILPSGPQWEECSIIIKEKNLNQIDHLLERQEKNYERMGRMAQEVYQKFFADEVYFDYVIEQVLDIKKNQKIPEFLFWSLRNFVMRYWILRQRWKATKFL